MSRQKSFGSSIRPMFLLLLVSLLLCGSALAQSGTANITGNVQDPQGGAIAGATVNLINESKNFRRTQTTNQDGGYTFTQIPPDTYRLEVEAAGFKKTVINDVRALVDTPLTVDAKMEVGAVTESVDVSASTDAPLNTTDASTGTTFESQRISELPLNARNVVNLLSLQPGVTRTGEVNGGRRDQANVTLDGIDVNEQQTGLDIVSGDAFGSVLRVTVDSVQEFRVTTSVPTANFGRSSGAQVSLVTKSGTNDFHGSIFGYHRNTVTTANDFFNNAEGRYTAEDLPVQLGLNRVGDERVPRPKLIRNIFGGSLGGPIKKDRFYFFYNYEGRRDAAEVSVLQVVPTATLRQGIVRFRNLDGGITELAPADIAALFPATGGVNPAGLALLQTAPLPNTFATGDTLNTAGFRFNSPISTRLNTHIGRLDYTVTDRQSLFFRANYQDDLYEQAKAFPNTPSPTLWVHPKGFVMGHSWTATNSLVNSFRVGLTRQAFSQTSDNPSTLINFRFVYQPYNYNAAVSRTTPVWNVTDDVSWIKGSHTVQFGTNMRFIRNNRTSFANSFDVAIVNPSYYANSGSSLSNPLFDPDNFGGSEGLTLDAGFRFDARAAVASVLGRFSQYSVNQNYDINGNLLPLGSPTVRSFATEEYELYVQDSYKVRPNLTLSYGVRWGVNTPVYERNGFQVSPTVSLGEFFQRRVAGAAAGHPVNELISIDLAGKANNRPGYYDTDWNNFGPTLAFAWSPDFGDNWFGRAIGRDGRSVIRGGFRQIYDRIGSALAVSFDLNSALGFSSSTTVSPNTVNTGSRVGPLFSGLAQNIRNDLRFIEVPGPVSFPLTAPADESTRIEQTLDDTLTTPKQYTWNLSYARELPKGLSFEFTYVGRAGRDLPLARDVMHFNNLRDPGSGQTWYEAAGILAQLREAGIPFDDPRVPRIPFFENLYPGTSLIQAFSEQYFGFDISEFYAPGTTPSQIALSLVDPNFGGNTDWTFYQAVIDDYSPVIGPNAFIHPQYAAFGVFSTVGTSDYHGGSVSVRQRYRNSFLFDFNYTLSKSMDQASLLESGAILGNMVRNPLDLNLGRSVSDFDIRHNINANWLAAIPIGRDRKFFGGMNRTLDAVLGGWQLTGIVRWNSGPPASFDALNEGSPFDVGQWATNWQLTSYGVRARQPNVVNSPNVDGRPNVFADPEAAYRAFRNARAGEVGDRNTIRIPSYFALDAGLSKSFKMPWEGHALQFRWETFNVTNTQRFSTISNFGLNVDPFLGGQPPADFGRYIGSQTPVGEDRPGRVMQFALRYTF